MKRMKVKRRAAWAALTARAGRFGAGVVAGVTAGLAAAVAAMVLSAFGGASPWTPLKLMAGVIMRQSAAAGRAGTMVVGLLVLLALAGLLGGLFSAVVRPQRQQRGSVVAFAVAYALVAFLVITFLVFPLVHPMWRTVNVPLSLVAYLVYGFTLGLLAPSLEMVPQGARPRTA